MSRCWDFEIQISDGRPTVKLIDFDEHISFEYGHPFGQATGDLDEDAARAIRDWLSWWLGDGPEPGGKGD